MSASMSSRFIPQGETRSLLIKWVVALLVPILVFTFVWSGEEIVNNVLLGILTPGSTPYDLSTLIQAAIFIVIFYFAVMALIGYLSAADSGRRTTLALWIDMFVFLLIPLIVIIELNDMIFGLAASAVIWVIFFYLRNHISWLRNALAPAPTLENVKVIGDEQRANLMNRATLAGFWFATAFALVSLIVDLIFFAVGSLPSVLLIWVVARTIILPIAGYFLGQLGGRIAIQYTLTPRENKNGGNGAARNVSKRRQLETLSATRAREEVKDIVPNDLPLQSTGARRFYFTLLLAFLLFYPVIDPFLFGSGTAGRLSNYSDAGRYVILALGLNIVVGFAGLLDLGYVAFFAIGAYVWGIFGSQQWHVLTGAIVDPQVWPYFFWPMIIVTACIAAFWGVILGAPTLRLRGDYLAIVTLGFGEIVPIVFLNMSKYTNGTNGISGVYAPGIPGVKWTVSTQIPYFYLILALIALVLFANIRLRDSRLGRAWIAIREDEIAAASSGINLVRTKLFAFGAGAFFSGIAGAYYAAKLSNVSPDNFSFSDSVIYLAMVVMGGIGSIPGVIVGALAVYAINVLILSSLDTLSADPQSFVYPLHSAIIHVVPGFTFSNIRNLIFGSILIIIMIFRPEGLIPSARRRRELHRVDVDTEAAIEVGPLDANPGTPGFESQVHVD
jgi:ABC-type branched-subunit amino acid transport system permease subunit